VVKLAANLRTLNIEPNFELQEINMLRVGRSGLDVGCCFDFK